MASRVLRAALLAACILATATTGAGAFGTWDHPPKLSPAPYAEHEMITRLALSCEGAYADRATCFEPMSIYELAGGPGFLGAVGAPDGAMETAFSEDWKHCDDGDYLAPGDDGGAVYPQNSAQANGNVMNCLQKRDQLLDQVVTLAGQLVDQDGDVDAWSNAIGPEYGISGNGLGACGPGGDPVACQDRTPNGDPVQQCDIDYDPVDGVTTEDVPKCQLLVALGRALHINEDFFSHGNWTDTPSPLEAIGPSNPPGLARTALPPVLRYPTPITIDWWSDTSPTGGARFMTECNNTGPAGSSCLGRANHNFDLQKDEGSTYIDYKNGTIPGPAPAVSRGQDYSPWQGNNFGSAVVMAAQGAQQLWSDVQAAILSQYGPVTGPTIIDAIRQDTPWTACDLSPGPNPDPDAYDASSASLSPTQDWGDDRTVAGVIVNATAETMSCEDATLSGGGWTAMLPDGLAPGASASFGTADNAIASGTQGEATYTLPSGSVTLSWDNPYWGGDATGCTTSGPYACQVGVTTGDAMSAVYIVTGGATSSVPTARAAGVPAESPRIAAAAPRGRSAPAGLELEGCRRRAHRRVSLSVDGIRCRAAERLLTATDGRRLCPAGWSAAQADARRGAASRLGIRLSAADRRWHAPGTRAVLCTPASRAADAPGPAFAYVQSRSGRPPSARGRVAVDRIMGRPDRERLLAEARLRRCRGYAAVALHVDDIDCARAIRLVDAATDRRLACPDGWSLLGMGPRDRRVRQTLGVEHVGDHDHRAVRVCGTTSGRDIRALAYVLRH